MGELFTSLRVGGENRQIKPVPRVLMCGEESYSMVETLALPGGLILGEGDTGKSTYAKLLAKIARAIGPVTLVALRRGEPLPKPPQVGDDEIATIIFDGLDERPDAVRDIVDLAEPLDHMRYHVWVTSRACDAASRLSESVRFEKIYTLADLLPFHVIDIAASVGLDGLDFIRAANEKKVFNFLDKPGSVVLLLQLYANGKLVASSPVELMETIALAFASETRDGHTMSALAQAIPPERLVDVASWIATAMELGAYKALWLGAKAECPEYDLALDDLPPCDFTRDEIMAVLERRTFEPLNPLRLRLSYWQMPDYLVGRWIAKRVPEDLHRCFVKSGSISWAACIRPEIGMRFIDEYPQSFARCHDVIRRFGFDRMVAACLREQEEIGSHDFVDLVGMEDFAEYLIGVLEKGVFPPLQLMILAYMLYWCHPSDREKASAAVVAAREQVTNPKSSYVDFVDNVVDGLNGTRKALGERSILEGPYKPKDYGPDFNPRRPNKFVESVSDFAEKCRAKKAPVEANVVAVRDEVAKELAGEVAKAVKNKGGRPRKKGRAADYMTQKEVAIMFNAACGDRAVTKDKVSNWESYQRTEGRRGSTPPEGMYGGRAVVYTADLREHPTPENKAILAAIIERFRSTRAVKDGIKSAQKIRYKSEESLHRMRGGTQAELARNRENL